MNGALRQPLPIALLSGFFDIDKQSADDLLLLFGVGHTSQYWLKIF